LVSIRYDPEQGLLYVYPDFSSSAQDLDYVIQIERNNDCRQLYAFGFENVTPLEAYDDDGFSEEADGEDEQELGDGLPILCFYYLLTSSTFCCILMKSFSLLWLQKLFFQHLTEQNLKKK